MLAYLQLMRPANMVTAMADILAGFAVAAALSLDGPLPISDLFYLLVATLGLYGGGIVFNDVFDAELDAKERPERPIPSGRVSVKQAAWLGSLLFLVGLIAAAQVNLMSLLLAGVICLLCLSYDSKAKHHPFLGPLNMGLCRGGNLLLGVSAFPAALIDLWFLGVIPLLYIGAITSISRGEVHGGNKAALGTAVFLYAFVIVCVIGLSWIIPTHRVVWTLPFLGLFAWCTFRPLLKAIQDLNPHSVRNAVKAGLLSLILLDASIAAGFAGWVYGALVLALLPLSILLARAFAMT